MRLDKMFARWSMACLTSSPRGDAVHDVAPLNGTSSPRATPFAPPSPCQKASVSGGRSVFGYICNSSSYMHPRSKFVEHFG